MSVFLHTVILWIHGKAHGRAPQGLGVLLATVLCANPGIRPAAGLTTLPAFGSASGRSDVATAASASLTTVTPACEGRVSRPVSLFARVPVCDHMCVRCQTKPCDVNADHTDHTCYDCAQMSRGASPFRVACPGGVAGVRTVVRQVWVVKSKCCIRYLRDFHACYWCSLAP